MFTGIVEEKGKIVSVKNGAKSCVLTIEGNVIFDDLKVGDSVSVNGVCLTASQISGSAFKADVMAETMRRTNLGMLKQGSEVNLERAMSANGRFGGHIVSGHIDGTGLISSLRQEDNAVWLTITAPYEIMRYIIMKGSIAIDGVSLTVAKLYKDAFAVSVIPHTASETILLKKRQGDKVNLECDIVGKYIEKLLGKPSAIDEEFLRKYNF